MLCYVIFVIKIPIIYERNMMRSQGWLRVYSRCSLYFTCTLRTTAYNSSEVVSCNLILLLFLLVLVNVLLVVLFYCLSFFPFYVLCYLCILLMI